MSNGGIQSSSHQGMSMLTNEERRVEVYTSVTGTTIPSQVTPDTPLSQLNLNWRERDLPEKERTRHVHRLHPYLGKFIPQLVEVFLRKYFRPGQRVFDPFCGSGTTLVQANELGIHAVGYDISAFNVLLCKAKTARYNLTKVRKEVLDILERVRVATRERAQQPSLWEDDTTLPDSSDTDNDYLKMWFAPQALQELMTYRRYIEAGGYEYQDLLGVILSRSARSARLTTHFDLDFPKKPQTEPYWCYKHSRECYPTQEALKFLHRYSLDTIRRIEEFAVRRTDATVNVCHVDSRKAPCPQVDGIITSPPYVGLIDYHEQHAYAYHLLGLEDQREREIGAATNGSSQRAQQAYKEDIVEVLRRAADAMRPGGRIIVVAHDKANLYDEIAERVGVEVEGIVQRHVNRRTGRRSSEFHESIFIWQKPGRRPGPWQPSAIRHTQPSRPIWKSSSKTL